ncbi:hypothetical protein ACF0H5_005006 [Mactra antiquata]
MVDKGDNKSLDNCNNDVKTEFKALNDNLNQTADPNTSPMIVKNNNIIEKDIKTGNLDNNMHWSNLAQLPPKKQQSSDSYTDDSQLNTFDKSEDEILFSDSVALSAFNTGKANIWQNRDIHGILTWQTDTSPSDNLENDEGYFLSLSHENTPSEDHEPNNGFQVSPLSPASSQFSPDGMSDTRQQKENGDSTFDANFVDCVGDFSNRSNNSIIPLEQLMHRMQRTPSCDTPPTIPSPGASG